MNLEPTRTVRVSVIYDAICSFQRTHRLPSLQHAQIRGLLAEHLARTLPAAVAAPVVPPPTRAADEERRDRYAKVLAGMPLRPPFPHCLAMADAVLAVAEAEQATIRAEVERLGDWYRTVSARATTAETDRDRIADELAVNEADRVAAVTRAKQAEELLAVAHETSNRSEAERKGWEGTAYRHAQHWREAQAAVDRVRAVLETKVVVGRTALEYRGLILSALMADDAAAVPAAAEEQPDTGTPGLCRHCGQTITGRGVTHFGAPDGPYYHVDRDACRIAGGLPPRPDTSTPEAEGDDDPPAPLRHSEADCPGFPEHCPNLLPVDPQPPRHYGGIRCGCADEAEFRPEEA